MHCLRTLLVSPLTRLQLCHILYVLFTLCKFMWTDQVNFNFEGRRKGLPVSKQLLSHSFDEAIALAYASKNETCPFVVCAHYTKISGVPLRLAFWA